MDNERQSRDFAGWKIISSPMLFKLISQYNISFGFFFFLIFTFLNFQLNHNSSNEIMFVHCSNNM